MPIDPKKVKWDASKGSGGPIKRNQIEWEQKPWFNVNGMVETLRNVGQVYPAFETAANLATSAYGVPISGLVGLAALPFGVEAADRAIKATQKFLVYQPQSEAGQQLMQAATYPIAEYEESVSRPMGEIMGQEFGPATGAITESALTAAPAIMGARSMIRKPRVANKKVQATVERGINKGVRPSVVKKEMFGQRQKYMQNARVAVDEIIKNKENLKLLDREGNTRAGLPRTLEQFSQAIEQTKRKIFREYDELAKRQVIDEPKLRKELEANTQRIQNLRGKGSALDIETMIGEINQQSQFPLMQQRGESNTTFASRVAKEYQKTTGKKPPTLTNQAEIAKIQELQSRNQTIQKVLETGEAPAGVDIPVMKIDMKPVVEELNTVIGDPVLNTMSPETIAYAKARQEALRGKSFTASQVQDMVKITNQTNKAFYANPTPEMQGRAFVDSLIANNLRSGLDAAVESATGVAYAPLKRKYGALRMLETDVTKRAIVDARKNIKGLIDFSDIFSGQQVVQGLIMRDPVMMASGGAVRGISSYIKYINDPNRIVRSMFKKVEKQTRKGKPNMGRSAAGMGAGAVAGQDEYRLYQ